MIITFANQWLSTLLLLGTFFALPDPLFGKRKMEIFKLAAAFNAEILVMIFSSQAMAVRAPILGVSQIKLAK